VVCHATGTTLTLERLVVSTSVASNRPDYFLHDAVTREIVGVVEAKRVGGNLRQAIVQAALQLTVLQVACACHSLIRSFVNVL